MRPIPSLRHGKGGRTGRAEIWARASATSGGRVITRPSVQSAGDRGHGRTADSGWRTLSGSSARRWQRAEKPLRLARGVYLLATRDAQFGRAANAGHPVRREFDSRLALGRTGAFRRFESRMTLALTIVIATAAAPSSPSARSSTCAANEHRAPRLRYRKPPDPAQNRRQDLSHCASLVSVAKRKIALRHGRFYGCSYIVFCLT